MPLVAHHARKVNPTSGAQFNRAVPRLSAAHPQLDTLDDDDSLIFVVDADEPAGM